jgi:hypothetical protein
VRRNEEKIEIEQLQYLEVNAEVRAGGLGDPEIENQHEKGQTTHQYTIDN